MEEEEREESAATMWAVTLMAHVGGAPVLVIEGGAHLAGKIATYMGATLRSLTSGREPSIILSMPGKPNMLRLQHGWRSPCCVSYVTCAGSHRGDPSSTCPVVQRAAVEARHGSTMISRLKTTTPKVLAGDPRGRGA